MIAKVTIQTKNKSFYPGEQVEGLSQEEIDRFVKNEWIIIKEKKDHKKEKNKEQDTESLIMTQEQFKNWSDEDMIEFAKGKGIEEKDREKIAERLLDSGILKIVKDKQ